MAVSFFMISFPGGADTAGFLIIRHRDIGGWDSYLFCNPMFSP